jgi:hypothetical protein
VKAGADKIGLCERCRHAHVVETTRSVFWLCGRAAGDPRFEKYPRLPVITCVGFEEGERETRSGPGHDEAG